MSEPIRVIVAKAIHASHKLKKPWDHPDTVRIWHPVCLREADAALKAYHKAVRRAGESR